VPLKYLEHGQDTSLALKVMYDEACTYAQCVCNGKRLTCCMLSWEAARVAVGALTRPRQSATTTSLLSLPGSLVVLLDMTVAVAAASLPGQVLKWMQTYFTHS